MVHTTQGRFSAQSIDGSLEAKIHLGPIGALLVDAAHREVAVEHADRGVLAEGVDEPGLDLLEVHPVRDAPARQVVDVEAPVLPGRDAQPGRKPLGVSRVDDVPPEGVQLGRPVRRVEVRSVELVAGREA